MPDGSATTDGDISHPIYHPVNPPAVEYLETVKQAFDQSQQ